MQIALVGDVMLGRLVNEALIERPPEYPWGNVLPILRSEADVCLCNMECVISDKGEPWSATPKEFHFRSDAKNVRVLSTAGVNAASLANNHSLDYGYEAAEDMLEILDNAGIRHSGLGRSLGEAESLASFKIQNKRIGFIAFTDNEPEWEATTEHMGIFFVPTRLKDKRAECLLNLVKHGKEMVDLLIVSAHWGPNWGYDPPQEHIPFAHALIEAGADIVFGHSGHVFKGIEVYRHRPILYCAGDFIDDYAIDPIERNDESFLFLLHCEDDSVDRIKLYPTKIEMFQANLARQSEMQSIGGKMRLLCEKLGTELTFNRSHHYYEVEIR